MAFVRFVRHTRRRCTRRRSGGKVRCERFGFFLVQNTDTGSSVFLLYSFPVHRKSRRERIDRTRRRTDKIFDEFDTHILV